MSILPLNMKMTMQKAKREKHISQMSRASHERHQILISSTSNLWIIPPFQVATTYTLQIYY